MRRITSTFAIAGLALVGSFNSVLAADANPALVQVVESRSEADRARDGARHPIQTLTFFQVEPGMTVAEALPGGGWYTNILANYLGAEGTLYGVNYAARMWPMFSFATEEWIAKRTAATAQFPTLVAGFTDNGIEAKGFTFNTVPPEASGSVDRVLMIRALHNLSRFEGQAGTMSQAMAAVRGMLREDGLVGVVQHRLPESAADDQATAAEATSSSPQSSACSRTRALSWSPAVRSTPMPKIFPVPRTRSGACLRHCGATTTTLSKRRQCRLSVKRTA